MSGAIGKLLIGAAVLAWSATFSSFAADASDDNDPPAGLLGDMGGLRPALARHGTTLGLTEASEITGNLHGGLRRGAAYRGLTTLNVTVDTGKAGAWPGGTWFASALQIHGRQFTQEHVGSFHTASNLEAHNATRLWELWYRHQLNDEVDLKIGQQSIDQEFIINTSASGFAAAYFGWPALPSVDLPASGGVYPLASPGVRLRAKLSDTSTVLAGVLAGDAANSSTQDPQVANAHGTTFSLHGGTLVIAEYQYARKQGLPGSYKFGAWHHSKRFADQRFDAQGLSQADPASNAGMAQHRGNYSVYAVADQTVWRASGDGPRAVNLFGRAMAAPGDRNLVSFSANLGVTVSAPFEQRAHDLLGIGLAYLKLGSRAIALDRDINAFNGTFVPVRSHEALLETTYQYQVAPWWMLQGIFQYTFRPGAGALDPADPTRTRRIPNATVLGVRTSITF